MPNLNDTTALTPIPTFGIEVEMGGISYSRFERLLNDEGITSGFKSVYDASLNVDAEIVTCPLAPCQTAWEYIQNLLAAINKIGRRELGSSNRLINVGCGLHVHIGNAFLTNGVDADEYCRKSIASFPNSLHLDHADTMDVALVKDIVWRYARQQKMISTMLANSRRQGGEGHRFCKEIDRLVAQIENANTISQLESILASVCDDSKFSSVTLKTWRKGTIEFRQHQGTTDNLKIRRWVEFLLNIVTHSTINRIDGNGTRTINHTTPIDPFRRNTRVGVQYNMMRTDNGATTRELMDATGCSEERVRGRVTEIRRRVGAQAVVTHTQQSNGANYGDGTDHTRYQVLQTYQEQTDGAELMPENRRGGESVWCGITDDHFTWWQDRIDTLR